MRPDRVWYVAYGSNVNEQRFLRYLQGDADHVGARDATEPVANRWSIAPLRLRFAGASQRWNGGGVAFVDPDPTAAAHVRCWNVSREQFEDVFAQENRRPVGSELDWTALREVPVQVGEGAYAQLVPLTDSIAFATQDIPAFTFTWSQPRPTNAPHDSYRSTIEAGFLTHPELNETAVQAYLDLAVSS